MIESTEDDESPPAGKRSVRRTPIGKSKIGGILLVLVAVYALLQPSLNQRFGLNLPALRPDATNPQFNRPPQSDNSRRANRGNESPAASEETLQSDQRVSADESSANRGSEIAQDSRSALLHGSLKEVSPQRYLSPAGLLYSPGSQEGHRLEHLRRHTVDDPGRPGSHGVFDGEMPGALQTIDRAYDRAKQGQRTTTQNDGDRTIYTVDMGGRVGFVGGRDGARRNHPMARRVRLVVQGNQFITAYPL
jgi:hypothetical protein